MNITWSDLKEVFLVIGSLAGLVALFRPLFESKYQRDLARVDRIKSILNEQSIVNLEPLIYQCRRVPDKNFMPFDQLDHEIRTNQEGVRFTGPLAKHLKTELNSMIASYIKLREFIQVNEWEPREDINEDGTKQTSWVFNKSAFEDADGIPRNYAEHLDKAAEQAIQLKKAFQRFQLVSEMHLYESPLASWILPCRFKTHNLC